MLAAHQLTPGATWQAVLAFIAFSLIASATYVLNDLLDLNADRAHPRKRNRPLAAGAVSVAQGTLLMPLLALAGIGAALLSGPALLGVLLLYTAVTSAYSFRLKRLVVIDICTLAVLYTLRILAGSAATGIPSSMWLLAFSTFFFFSLAAVKRQAELVDGIAAGRLKAHGRGYEANDLAIVGNIAGFGGHGVRSGAGALRQFGTRADAVPHARDAVGRMPGAIVLEQPHRDPDPARADA